MKTRAIFTVLALIASLAPVAPATAKPGKAQGNGQGKGQGNGQGKSQHKGQRNGQGKSQDKGSGKAIGKNAARGTIILEGLTLAGTQFGTPSGQPTTVATDPVSLPVSRGDTFTYSTITCASAFPPWNTFGLHFQPDYPGVNEGPTGQGASVRHELRGTVTKSKAGGTGKVRGTITTFLCENGMRTDQIVNRYKARFSPTSATSVPLVGGGPVPTTGGLALRGKFKIIGGTGRFEDLKGHGRMIGQFTCLPQSLTRNAKSSCTALGGYSEAPFQLRGRYRDPTVPSG